MKRRDFLAGLGAAGLSSRRTALAQRRVARVGYLAPDPAAANAPFYMAFRVGLSDLGYVEGETVKVETRFSEYGGQAQLSALAGELAALEPDVIVAGGPAVYAAHTVTRTIPIVAAVGGDLVGAGLADSIGHPGGNVTGSTFFAEELQAKRVAWLKQAKPEITSVGLLFTKGFPGISRYLDKMNAPAAALGVALRPMEVSDPGECERALNDDAGPAGGLVVIDLPLFTMGPGPGIVAAAAARRRTPAAGGLIFGRNGGLLGYGADFQQMHRRAATFVDKILKGARPGDIPIEQATKFVTIVNLKTARALDLDLPPTLLAGADEVIE